MSDRDFNKDGQTYFELKEYKKAIECFDKAIEINPKHTAKSLSFTLKLAQRTIERDISNLRKNGFINKKGATKNGIWEILK